MLAARLYNRSLWEGYYLYRTILVSIRIAELAFILLRLLFFLGPLLVVWTRLPGLRGRQPPYSDLAEILGPTRDRPPILLHEVHRLSPGDCTTKEELRAYCDMVTKQASVPRPTIKTIFGGFLRALFAQMGPCYIKLAQIVSMRPEVPPFMREELQIIQDSLPPIKQKVVRDTIDREMRRLGKRKEDVFEWIEEKPLAAASLAQVNRAKLITGEEVALKIQRPHLQGYVVLDSVIIVEILIVRVVPIIRSLRKIDLSVFHASFRSCLRKEVDFNHEARTQEDFRRLFARMPHFANTIKVAKVYNEYSTDKLITMDLVKNFYRADRLTDMGVDKLWDLMSVKLPGYPESYPVHMFRLIPALWGDMAMYWGWMHGDPHLGNMYFMEPQEGYGWRLFVCDFGMVEEQPPQVQAWALDSVCMAWMWKPNAEKWMQVALRYMEPRRRFYEGLARQPTGLTCKIMRQRQTRRAVEEFERLPPGPAYLAFIAVCQQIIRGRVSEETTTLDESGTPHFIQTRRPGGQTYSRDVLDHVMLTFPVIMAALLPPGERVTRTMQHHHFLWFKEKLYTEEIGSTLWMGMSWNDEFIHAAKERMKERFRYNIKRGNVIDVKEYVEEVADYLYQPELVSLAAAAVSEETTS